MHYLQKLPYIIITIIHYYNYNTGILHWKAKQETSIKKTAVKCMAIQSTLLLPVFPDNAYINLCQTDIHNPLLCLLIILCSATPLAAYLLFNMYCTDCTDIHRIYVLFSGKFRNIGNIILCFFFRYYAHDNTGKSASMNTADTFAQFLKE